MTATTRVIQPPRKIVAALCVAIIAAVAMGFSAPANAAVGSPTVYPANVAGATEVCPSNNIMNNSGAVAGLASAWSADPYQGYWILGSNTLYQNEICNYGYAGYFGGNVGGFGSYNDPTDPSGIAAVPNGTGLFEYDAKGYVSSYGSVPVLTNTGTSGPVGSSTNASNVITCGGTTQVGKMMSLTSTPNSEGAWALDQFGNVYQYGIPNYVAPTPGTPQHGTDCSNGFAAAVTQGESIIANPNSAPDGQGGYAVIYADGCLRNFQTASAYKMPAMSAALGSKSAPTNPGDWSNGCWGPATNNGNSESGTIGWFGQAMVAAATTPSGDGIIEVSSGGYVCAMGNVTAVGGNGSGRNWCFTPPTGAQAGATAVDVATTSDGGGYWVLWGNGVVVPYGDATGYGDAENSWWSGSYNALTTTPNGQLLSDSGATCTVNSGNVYYRSTNAQYNPSTMNFFNYGDVVLSFPSTPYVGAAIPSGLGGANGNLAKSLGYTSSYGDYPGKYYDPVVNVFGSASILWTTTLPGLNAWQSALVSNVGGGSDFLNMTQPSYVASGVSYTSGTPWRQALAGPSSNGGIYGYNNGSNNTGAWYITNANAFTFPAFSALKHLAPANSDSLGIVTGSGSSAHINGVGLVNPNGGSPKNDEIFSTGQYSGSGSMDVHANTGYYIPTVSCIQASVGIPSAGTWNQGWNNWVASPTLSDVTSNVVPSGATDPLTINDSLAVTSAQYAAGDVTSDSVGVASVTNNTGYALTQSTSAIKSAIAGACPSQQTSLEWASVFGSLCLANVSNPFSGNLSRSVNGTLTSGFSTGGSITVATTIHTASGGTTLASPVTMRWLPTVGLTVGTLNTPGSTSTTDSLLNGETAQIRAAADGAVPSGYSLHIWQVSNTSGSSGVTELTSAAGCGSGVQSCTVPAPSSNNATQYFQAVLAQVGQDPAPSWSASSYQPSNVASGSWGTGSMTTTGANSCIVTGTVSLALVLGANNVGPDGTIVVSSSSGQSVTIPGQFSGTIHITGSNRSVAVSHDGTTGTYNILGWTETRPGQVTYSASVTFGASVSPGSTPSGTPPPQSFGWSTCTPSASIYPT